MCVSKVWYFTGLLAGVGFPLGIMMIAATVALITSKVKRRRSKQTNSRPTADHDIKPAGERALIVASAFNDAYGGARNSLGSQEQPVNLTQFSAIGDIAKEDDYTSLSVPSDNHIYEGANGFAKPFKDHVYSNTQTEFNVRSSIASYVSIVP